MVIVELHLIMRFDTLVHFFSMHTCRSKKSMHMRDVCVWLNASKCASASVCTGLCDGRFILLP